VADIIIKTEKVSKIYNPGKPNEVRAMIDMSMEIPRGSSVVINGPSGSGKTTLLSLIGTLDRPTRGKVFIEGDDVSRLSDFRLSRLRREKMGFVYQLFNLIPRLEVWENVGYPLIPLGIGRKERRRKALELLEKLGVGHRADHVVGEISVGEQQRVCIARALINDPEVLIADEPSSSIDTQTAREVLDIFRKLIKEGKTLIVATHDPLMSTIGEKVVRIRDGRVMKIEERR